MTQQLRSSTYANLGGKVCPYCGSKQFFALGPVDVDDDGTAHQQMGCDECHKKWYDQYELAGFRTTKSGDVPMMDPDNEARVDEMITTMSEAIKAGCVRLYHSGCVNVESYAGKGYTLANLLLYVTLEQHQKKVRPLTNEFLYGAKTLLRY